MRLPLRSGWASAQIHTSRVRLPKISAKIAWERPANSTTNRGEKSANGDDCGIAHGARYRELQRIVPRRHLRDQKIDLVQAGIPRSQSSEHHLSRPPSDGRRHL